MTAALVRQKHDVVVIDNLYRGRLEHLAAQRNEIEFIEGDIRDRPCLRTAMRGVSLVFHLAAQSNVMGAEADPDYSFSTNVQGSIEVLRAAREAGARRVVFSSSREVYGDAASLPVRESAALAARNCYGRARRRRSTTAGCS